MSSTEHADEALPASISHGTFGAILRFDLRSNLLRACYYQPSTRLLAIRTRSGRWLIHQNVEREIVHALTEGAAPGFLYARHLRGHLGKTISQYTMRSIRLLFLIGRLERAHRGQMLASIEYPDGAAYNAEPKKS